MKNGKGRVPVGVKSELYSSGIPYLIRGIWALFSSYSTFNMHNKTIWDKGKKKFDTSRRYRGRKLFMKLKLEVDYDFTFKPLQISCPFMAKLQFTL